MEDADLARYFETIQQGLQRIEANVAQFRVEVHERFERNEARLDRLEAGMQERFERNEARLDRLEAGMHERFERNEARLDRLEGNVAQIRAEMHERFELVDDRLRELGRVQEQFSVGLVEVIAAIARIDVSLERLHALGRATNTHLLDLREEMQQRFRVVNERLAELAA